MINGWLDTRAVREWWIDAKGEFAGHMVADDLDSPDVVMHLVSYRAQPFAYIQNYDPHAWPNHHFDHLPPSSRGIDQFIGVAEMLGCGHGSDFIEAYVEALFASGAPAVGTDPHPSNARAIRAYEKAGFRRMGERMTEWGPCLLMARYADE